MARVLIEAPEAAGTRSSKSDQSFSFEVPVRFPMQKVRVGASYTAMTWAKKSEHRNAFCQVQLIKHI
jgi:hypothetical protein